MNLPIPEPLARAIAQVPADLVHEIADLIGRIVSSPNPRETAARALQVAAHEHAADAAVDAAFAAKGKIVGSGV